MTNVSFRLVSELDISHILFICQMTLFSSLTLLMISKPGDLSLKTLKAPATWGIGITFIIDQALFLVMMGFLTATVAVFIGKLNIIFSLMLAVIFNKRKFYKGILIGTIPLVLGAVYMMDNEGVLSNIHLFTLVVLYSFNLAAHLFLIEIHDTNNKTLCFSDDTRVTALVIGVTNMFFLSVIGLLFLVENLYNYDFGDLTPSIGQALNTKAFLYAAFLGIVLTSFTRYLEFVSIRKVKTEYFLALSVISPVLTYFFEKAIGFDAISLTFENSMAASLILSGCLLIVVFGRKESAILNMFFGRKRPSKKQLKQEVARERVIATLIYFKDDMEQASKALGVSVNIVTHVLDGTKEYADSTLDKIRTGFSNNVESKDPVTGLQNRLMFMTKKNKSERENIPYSLMFIDLNKFKPVNDTYGHDVGDMILKGVSDRLHNAYAHEAEISRLGGDEFCLLFYKMNLEAALQRKEEVEALIATPFDVGGVSELIDVSASIGCSSFPEDGKGEDIMKIADKRMYENKG